MHYVHQQHQPFSILFIVIFFVSPAVKHLFKTIGDCTVAVLNIIRHLVIDSSE